MNLPDPGSSFFPDQTLSDVRTIINNIGTGSVVSHARIEAIVGALLDSLSHSTTFDKSKFNSSLKTLHLLLQVCVCDEEILSGYNSELAVKSLNIASDFLKNNVKSFDSNSDTLYNIVYLSLVLMSSKNLAENADKLIANCEDSLSIYLATENQQVDNFDSQNALHLLTVILSALCKREMLCDSSNRLSNNLKISHDLVVQLALCNNDTLRAQSLIILIPKILKQEKNNAVLEKLLDAVVVCENEESLNRALAALSALCTYYLPDLDGNLTCCAEGNNSFWLLIERGLCSDSPISRKHALFLVRRCVSCLSNTEKTVNCDMFFWDSKLKENHFQWWQDVCTVLEVLEERAFHLISPVLSTLENIFSSCVKDPVPPCFLNWCLTVFRRLLQHSCIHVVKWGVDILIGDVGCDLISGKHSRIFYPFFLETLIHSLNSPQIFYEMEDSAEDDEEIPKLENLKKFFVNASKSDTKREFFSKLIDVMGTFNWAPISLFIITLSLSKVPSFECLNPKDTPMIRRLVAKVSATQNVSIRSVCVQCLLVTVINLIEKENLDLTAVLDILTAFHSVGNFVRGSLLWVHIVTWLSHAFNENQVVSWMTENAIRSNSPPVLAQLVILLSDACLLRNFESLESIFNLLSDCDTRLYADQDAQMKCVQVVTHMVKTIKALNGSDKPLDKTREGVLYVVKPTVCNMAKLFRMRLFCIENLNAYHSATELLKCFKLLCKDKQVALMFSKEKSCSSFISTAFDIVENDFQQKKISFVFAMNVVNIWCKAVQDFQLICQSSERSSKVLKMILESNILIQPPFPQASQLPQWTQEILGSVSSAVLEAEWEFVELNISESPTESLSEQIVHAVGVGLDTGGRNTLPLLLKVLRKVLVNYPKQGNPTCVLRQCWSNVLEVRRTDIFYSSLREFLRVVFQPDIFVTSWGSDFASECGLELLGSFDSSCGVVEELVLELNNLVRQKPEIILLGSVRSLVVSCFVLSTIQRRDQRLMNKITSSSFAGNSDSVLQFLKADSFTFVRCVSTEILTFVLSGPKEQATEIADLLAEDLLQQAETPEAKRTRYFSNSLTHRLQFHILQGLMLVEPKISQKMKEALGMMLLKRLINENHQLSVRYLTEWLLVRICSSVSELRNHLLDLVEAGDIRESALCSVISTLLHFSLTLQEISFLSPNPAPTYHTMFPRNEAIIFPCIKQNTAPISQSSLLQESKSDSRIFLGQFFDALLPLTMSQAYSVRFNAHVAILQVWEVMRKFKLEDELKQHRESASAVQKSFNRASNKFQNHKDFYLTRFRCVQHYSLETLFYDMPRLTLMTRDELIKPNLLFSIGRSCKDHMPLTNEDRGLEEFNSTVDRRREDNSTESPNQSSCVQKKMVPSKWLEINEIQLKALPEFLRPWRKDGSSDLPSRGLVVVASLVDKASNLGGLSRTCEIMGASLVLPKLSFTSDREFQALSMSSEMWAPLSEVKPHELLPFLSEMKRLGFTLVGAEQTAKSTSLSNFKFSENTVLLLGNERAGIPSNLLPLLDVCVEIPQYGLVRSLNVHVAGALFIHEYRRQHSGLAVSFSGIDQ